MSYTITPANGTNPIVIADGTVDTSTSIALVGKNTPSYGQYLDQNFLNMLENFANTTSPISPITGQIWYDAGNAVLKVYNGSVFKNIASATASASAPVNPVIGDLWFNTTNNPNQLNCYNGSSWVTIGPVTGTGQVQGEILYESNATAHNVISFFIGSSRYAILNKDQAFTPNVSISGFSIVNPGLNIASSATVSNNKFWGQSSDSAALGGVTAASFMRADQLTSTVGTLSVLNNTGLYIGATSQALLGISSNEFRIDNTLNNGVIRLRNRTSVGAVQDAFDVLGNGYSSVNYDLLVSGNLSLTNTSSNLRMAATTISTNTTTGAITVAGGVGIAGQLNVGGATNIFGGTISATGISSSGTATVTGNVTAGNVNTGNITATGNITTSGYIVGTIIGSISTPSIDNTPIGQLGPAAGKFTTLVATTSTTSYGTIAGPTLNAQTIGNSGANFTGATVVLTGGMALNSNATITSDQATAQVFNLNSTTVNMGGAATSVNIGSATGTTTINNNLKAPSFTASAGGNIAGYFIGAIGANGANSGSFTTVVTTGNTYSGGNIIAASGTGSSSTTTGALVVSGGAGVSGSVVAGAIVSANIGPATSTQLKFGINGQTPVYIDTTGNLNVVGNTTLISTGAGTLFVKDSTGAGSGTINSSATAVGIGSYTNTQYNLLQNNQTRAFIDTQGNVNVSTNLIVNGQLQVLGTITSAGSSTITTSNKNLTLANNQSTTTGVDGAGIYLGNTGVSPYPGVVNWTFSFANLAWVSTNHIIPTLNSTYNLGSASYSWNSIYGTIATAAQPSITSVGTLTSATVSGTTNLQGTTNGATINATNLLATTIGNTAAAINGNLANFSAVYAGTIGNTGANHFGATVVTTGNVYSGGNIIAAATTLSSSTTTGSIVAKGGVGIAGNLNVGGYTTFSGAYTEAVTINLSAGATYSVDLSASNVFEVQLNNNTTFTFINPPVSGTLQTITIVLKQDSVGGRTATWPSSVRWSSGLAPVLTTNPYYYDVVSFITFNGGTTYLGAFSMANVAQ